MTRDGWAFHGKEILHKAPVAHRHLKPMDFQLVVFSQSNLQERKGTLQQVSRGPCAHPPVLGTSRFLLPPGAWNKNQSRSACSSNTLLDGICLKREFQEELLPSARSGDTRETRARAVKTETDGRFKMALRRGRHGGHLTSTRNWQMFFRWSPCS